MITQSENYRAAAADKLNKEYKAFKGNRYQQVMKSAVRDALLTFIEQDNEFAQAIAQGGSFADCMKSVSKGIGNAISDIDAYKRAVQFYFPGADISFTMTVKLNPHEESAVPAENEQKPAETPKASALSLSLDDLF